MKEILKRYWGYDAFREKQEDIISSVLEGNDTLALLPTGGGKSICYQVPALLKEGVCIVISPLIALMKDQVQNLKSKGINAIYIHSGMNYNEIDILLDNCVYGEVKFLYVSPERLQTDIFRERFLKMNVSLIAVDEAHCISQWGYDFRPAYLKISEIRELKKDVPILAVTATATKKVVEDIVEKLELNSPKIISKTFYRENLSYSVLYEEDKLERLLRIIKNVNGTGIVYAKTRARTKEVADYLRKQKVSVAHYHAGLDSKVRNKIQEDWIENKIRVIVSTNAFGMGIDKPDVRFVVHVDCPSSIEAYFQEAGRAGRDEKNAFAVLLYNNHDKIQLTEDFEKSFPPITEIKSVYKALANFYQLAYGSGKDTTVNFNISEFCKRYDKNIIDVYNALKFLELEGLISLSDAFYQPSKLRVLMDSKEIYKFQVEHVGYDSLLKVILRTYEGVFDRYVTFNEDKIAVNAQLDKSVLTKQLAQLHKLRVIDYIPQNNQPQLTFLTEILPENHFSISKEVYHFRKEVRDKQLKSILNYVTKKNVCRSILLLEYFNDNSGEPCGICDVCLDKKRNNLTSKEFNEIKTEILKLLHQNSLSYSDITKELSSIQKEKIIKVINWLADNQEISKKKNDLYSIS